MNPINRRNFLKSSMYTATAFSIIPSYVLGKGKQVTANDKLNIAGIGVGGMGKEYLKGAQSENIIALCDVDDAYAAKSYGLFPKAKRYQDFRIMLEKEKGIDAIMIGTPDHSHAIITKYALGMEKHVYCAKPLTRTVSESRTLTEMAHKTNLATQVSMQMNASEDHRLIAEWIAAGAIGPVRAVHIWSNRPIWPQGINRPEATPAIPPTLNWDLWLGPAPKRPYHPAYVPFKWRGWWDFGSGALGDMGCHAFDPVFRALKLGYPTSVEASSTKLFAETAPVASIVHYDFPKRDKMPALKLTWFDGELTPPRPSLLEPGRQMGDGFGGILFYGNDGILMAGGIGGSPRLIPETRMKEFQQPDKTLPRSPGHYKEWINACKGGKPAGCNFDYAGPLTETVLLGNVAIRTGKKLFWDAKNLEFSTDDEANRFLREPYHNGWTL